MREKLLSRIRIFAIFIFNVLVSSFVFGQNWLPLHEGFNYSISNFLVIEESDELLMTGAFDNAVNGIDCNGFCIWDGDSFIDPLGQTPWNSARWPLIHNDSILFIGTAPGNVPDTVYRYNNYTVESLFTIPPVSQSFITYNDTYISVVPSFTEAPTIYIWDGNALDSANFVNYEFDSLYGTWAFCNDMIVFDDKVILCGNIHSTDYPGMKEIMTWNGNEFGSLGDGIPGFSALAMEMEIFNNELYIGGLFWQDEGNPTSGIVKWDGENYLPVGNIGANSRVDCLVSHGGYLYVSGGFTTMDNIPCRIARWDGEIWEAFNNDNFQFNSFDNEGWIQKMVVFRDTLYIAKGFHEINDVSYNHIARYNGMLPTNPNVVIEESANNQLSIFPNPASKKLTINTKDIQNAIESIKVYNMLGKEIYSKNMRVEIDKLIEIDVSLWTNGLYVVKVMTEDGRFSSKFVKE